MILTFWTVQKVRYGFRDLNNFPCFPSLQMDARLVVRCGNLRHLFFHRVLFMRHQDYGYIQYWYQVLEVDFISLPASFSL